MRVLILSLNYFPRFIGGAEIAIKEITDRIASTDIEFHLITLRYDSTLPTEEQVGNVKVHRIGLARAAPTIPQLRRLPLRLNKYFYQFYAAAVALRLHRLHRYDLVWAMMAHSAGIPAALFKLRRPEVKYLLTLQEGDPPEYIERVVRPLWPLFRRAFTSADHVQAISSFLLSWARRMGFKGAAEIIPNAVAAERFGNPATDWKHRLGKCDGNVFLVTTSRLVRKNAVDDVIRAMPFLPANIIFVVAGIGPEEATLKSLAVKLKLEDRVRFLGEVAQGDLPALLASCDVFVRPSRSEGLGISFIEAMAAGLPVVATQEGGIADFLFDEERNPGQATTGWAVDPDSPEQVAKTVRNILADPAKVSRVTRTARDMVLSKYDWHQIAGQMRSLLLGLG